MATELAVQELPDNGTGFSGATANEIAWTDSDTTGLTFVNDSRMLLLARTKAAAAGPVTFTVTGAPAMDSSRTTTPTVTVPDGEETVPLGFFLPRNFGNTVSITTAAAATDLEFAVVRVGKFG